MTINHIAKWKSDSNYMGEDYSEYYIAVSHHRDSDLIAESNFYSIKEYLEHYYPDQTEVVRLGHWAVGWVELLLIHESNVHACDEADQIIADLENKYPIYDEDDWSRRVYESAEEIWLNSPEWEREELCKALDVEYDGTDYMPAGMIDLIVERWEL